MMRVLIVAILLTVSAPQVVARPAGGISVVSGNKKKKKKDKQKPSTKLSKQEIEESRKLTEKFRKRDRAREMREARLAEWLRDRRPLPTMPPREIEEPKKKSPPYAIDFDIYIFESPPESDQSARKVDFDLRWIFMDSLIGEDNNGRLPSEKHDRFIESMRRDSPRD